MQGMASRTVKVGIVGCGLLGSQLRPRPLGTPGRLPSREMRQGRGACGQSVATLPPPADLGRRS